MSGDQQQLESLASDDTGRCQFPIGPGGQVCARRVARSGQPGRPSTYCDQDGHTRAKAFAARRAYERAAHNEVGGEQRPGGIAVDVMVGERPVSDGRTSFGALLARFEDVAAAAVQASAAQQVQLAEILAAATEVVRTVSDPDAAGYEVEQIQREASVRVAEAQTAQAAAERDARDARKELRREIELRAQADEAAEQALQEVDTVRAEMAEAIARITAETQAAIAKHQQRAEIAAADQRSAREELERVRAETAEAITVAQTAAEQHSQQTVAERDRILAEREAEVAEVVAAAEAAAQVQVQAAQRAVEEARAAAEAQIRRVTGESEARVAEAQRASLAADTARAAAEQRAADGHAVAEQLRAELTSVRAEHRAELEQLRADYRNDRDQLRADTAARLEELRTAHRAQLEALSAVYRSEPDPDTLVSGGPASRRSRRRDGPQPSGPGESGD